MRKSYDKTFKAKVALDAIKETSTLQELARKYDVHPNQISQWKQHLLEGVDEIFERANKKTREDRESDKEREQLLQVVGEMKIENDFLKKKYRQLYGKEHF